MHDAHIRPGDPTLPVEVARQLAPAGCRALACLGRLGEQPCGLVHDQDLAILMEYVQPTGREAQPRAVGIVHQRCSGFDLLAGFTHRSPSTSTWPLRTASWAPRPTGRHRSAINLSSRIGVPGCPVTPTSEEA